MTIVLIPLDTSRNSHICLEYYLQHVHRPGNKVHIIYVADYFGEVGPLEGPSPGRMIELEDQDKQRAAAIEAEVSQHFKTHQVDGDFTRLHGKDVWHVIIDQAEKVKADMIVMGSRGSGMLRRTFMGSTSDSVLHHSHIPVLVCKHHDKKHGHHE